MKDSDVSRQGTVDAQSTCARDKACVESKKVVQENARINLNRTTVISPAYRYLLSYSWSSGDRTPLTTILALDTMDALLTLEDGSTYNNLNSGR